MSERQWFALYTKANQESIAIQHIERQSFEVYCPMMTRTRRHARKVEQVKRPLFPSYICVRFSRTRDQWRPLLSTRGVRSLVKFGDSVGLLPEDFVEHLRAHEDAGRLSQFLLPKVEPGDCVTLTEGPFRNFVARVLSAPEKDRVWLLLDVMGRQTRVLQDTSALVPA